MYPARLIGFRTNQRTAQDGGWSGSSGRRNRGLSRDRRRSIMVKVIVVVAVAGVLRRCCCRGRRRRRRRRRPRVG